MLMLFVVVLFSCSVPDDPSYDRVVAGINNLPPDKLAIMKLAHSSASALEWWQDRPSAQDFMDLDCVDEAGRSFGNPVQVMTMVACLLTSGNPVGALQPRSLSQCIEMVRQNAHDEHWRRTGLQSTCNTVLRPFYRDAKKAHPEWEPENVSDDDIARELLASEAPPSWVYGSLFVVVGGIVVIGAGPAAGSVLVPLCAQSVGWACPADPRYPVGKTPQPDGAP